MAGRRVLAAQHALALRRFVSRRRRGLGRHQRRRLGLDHAQRVTLGALAPEVLPPALTVVRAIVLIASLAVLTRIAAWPVALVAVVARTIVPGSIVPGSIVSGSIVSGSVVALAVFALLAVWAKLALAVFTRPVVVALRAVIAGPIFALAVLALLLAVVAGPLIAPLPLFVAAAVGGAVGFRLGDFLAVLAIVLEIDVVSGDELIASHDLGHRPLRLHRPQ